MGIRRSSPLVTDESARQASSCSRGPEVPPHRRRVVRTAEFERWQSGLNADRRASVEAAIARVVAGGPTLGRPRVDVIHRSGSHKLKEARVDRSVRLLFAFDSNRDVAMLVGGDKAGKWNRWYPEKIKQAERLLARHERTVGKGARCLSQRTNERTAPTRGL